MNRTTPPQTTTRQPRVRVRLEELFGRYWDLAFQEGKTGANHADEANAVLFELRNTLAALGAEAKPQVTNQEPVVTLLLDEAQQKLTRLMVAGCTCATKTPDVAYHADTCHYRLAQEVGDLLERVSRAAPEFKGVARRKLQGLLDEGYVVTGLAIEKPAEDPQAAPRRGFITTGGMVGWWMSEAERQAQDDRRAQATEKRRVLEAESANTTEAFKDWYDAVWLGDQEHGQTLPTQGDPLYAEYLQGYTLGLGAWKAALSR